MNIASDTSLMGKRRTVPSLAGLVEDVDDIEFVGMLSFQGVEFFAKKDIFFGHVGEQKCELGLVAG